MGKTLPVDAETKNKVDQYYRKYGVPATNGTITTFEQVLNEIVSPRLISPYIYKGQWFDNKKAAATAAAKEGVSFGGFTWRTVSPLHPEIISVRNPAGKNIPNTPEINAKLKEMCRAEEAYYKRRPGRRK